MDDRTLRSVTWRQQHANQMELEFETGDVETVAGSHADASAVAREAGLSLEHSPLGSVRWTRQAPPRGGRAPKRIGPWLSS